ncbi:MAG: DUF3108 domain-containing protein [Vitreoscilla sp.]|nr:DUF3108 domain-containing protein [Vitreoscilla sp.]
MLAAAPNPSRRRLALLALGAVVTLTHLALGHWWFQQRMGFGMGDVPVKAITVRLVKELALAPPPRATATPPTPRRTPPAAVAAAPQAAASAPEPAASQAAAPAAPTHEPPVADDMALDRPMGAPVIDRPSTSSPSASSGGEAFEWPPSTQLRYDLVGHYRGPVKGWAEVNWLRDGDHYQVKLELRVPPLFGRRILSDGLVGPDGLAPRRYDQETEMLLRDTVRDTLLLTEDSVQLANGQRTRSLPGMQDTASQFVQMTWLFITQPELLKVGGTVEFPLALPRRVVPWRYEVVEQVPIQLPFGEAWCFHLKPAAGLSQPGELSVETWVAPSLQYLPVRILVRQNAETYLQLDLKSAPLQAAP